MQWCLQDMNDRVLNELSELTKTLVKATEASQHEKLETASGAFVIEQSRVTTLVDELQNAIKSVDGDMLNKVAGQLAEWKQADETRLQNVHRHITLDLNAHVLQFAEFKSRAEWEFNAMKGQMQQMSQARQFDIGSSGGDQQRGGGRPREIRVPDPKSWDLEVLKDGEHGFRGWRTTFDLQVRSIWGDLEKLLVEIRDDKEVFTGDRFSDLMIDLEVVPKDANQ